MDRIIVRDKVEIENISDRAGDTASILYKAGWKTFYKNMQKF